MPDSPVWLDQLAAAEVAGAQGHARSGKCGDPECTYCPGLPAVMAERSEVTVGGWVGATVDAIATWRNGSGEAR